VGIYGRFILPTLIDLGMRNKEVSRRRAQLVPKARGCVLEIGIGSGRNLPFYSNEVTSVCGIDPSNELLAMTRKRLGSARLAVELLNSRAEEIPLQDESFDSVVMTWTLCSISDPGKALFEIRRVLKAGGELFFVEHGRAPEQSVRKWQERINRPWRAVAGGCNLNRAVDGLIASSGLTIQQLDTGYLPGPKMFTFTYQGCARKT
jgi:ubiquinone/menaquinone biosynthesis C-methylase UbiE